jgi:hypothetical protein
VVGTQGLEARHPATVPRSSPATRRFVPHADLRQAGPCAIVGAHRVATRGTVP